MKVNKVNLASLRNEEHFQFMTDVKNLVESIGAQVINIDQLFSVFTNLYGKEDVALEVIWKRALTNLIAEADAQRNSIYRGLVLLVETFSHSTNVGKMQAAGNIQIIIDHYGDVRTKSYNEETASIYNLLQDLNNRCANDIIAINAQDWVNDLSSANQNFNNLMNQRFDENAGQEVVNMRETRKAIDKIYTQIIDRINASVLLNKETISVEFINRLNQRVDYYKNTVAQRKGRMMAKKEKKSMI